MVVLVLVVLVVVEVDDLLFDVRLSSSEHSISVRDLANDLVDDLVDDDEEDKAEDDDIDVDDETVATTSGPLLLRLTNNSSFNLSCDCDCKREDARRPNVHSTSDAVGDRHWGTLTLSVLLLFSDSLLT